MAIDVLKPESSELSTISCGHVVNAAGPHAATVHRMIKNNDDLPIRPRKRNVFVLHCTEPSLQNCPMLIDKSGVYVFVLLHCSSAYMFLPRSFIYCQHAIKHNTDMFEGRVRVGTIYVANHRIPRTIMTVMNFP